MSHLYKRRLKKPSTTEFNENWLDYWEYLEEQLEFFLEFFVHTTLQQWALKWKNAIRTLKNVIKFAIWRLALDKTQRKVTRWLGATRKNTWNFFFRIFRPYPAPAVVFKVEKNAILSFKTSENVLRWKVGKTKFINISYRYN